MATRRQEEVTASVVRAWLGGDYYRARSAGERVTLASLHRAGVLVRRAWRGVEGQASCAYEYAPSPALIESLHHSLQSDHLPGKTP